MVESGDNDTPELRRRALRIVERRRRERAADTTADSAGLLHELQVHQIELELQNGELRRTQQALEELGNHYRDLFDQAPVAYLVLSFDGHILQHNEIAAELLGTPQATGRHLQAFCAPPSADTLHRHLRQLRRDTTRADCEVSLRGTPAARPVRLESRRIGGDHGAQVRTALFDLSALRSAERALASSEARLQGILDTAPVGVGVVRDGALLWCNPQWGEMLGRSTEALAGSALATLFVDPDSAAAHDAAVWADGIESTWRHHDGRAVEVWLRSRRGDDEREFIVTAQDISESKETQRRLARESAHLEAVNRELEQFAYVASHDLRAPLRAVSGLVSLLREDLARKLDDEDHAQMTLLQERVQRMDALIEGLLSYSRVGRQPWRVEPVDSAALVDELTAGIAAPPDLRFERGAAMPHLETDREVLGRVLGNLLTNAARHGYRPGGRVRVDARDQGACYEFTVADDGPGIAANHQARIFDMFQTLQRQRGEDGTGIGLAVVKKIVENAGGRITLTSEPGAGSTFRFTWPKRLPSPS